MDNILGEIRKWFGFGGSHNRRFSEDDKEYFIGWLLKNDKTLKLEEIATIYMSGAYKADGKYWRNTENVFNAGEYHKLKKLKREIIWGDGDFDELRMATYFYIVLFKNGNMLVEVEISQLNTYITTDASIPAKIAIKKNINKDQLKYFDRLPKDQIFPY